MPSALLASAARLVPGMLLASAALLVTGCSAPASPAAPPAPAPALTATLTSPTDIVLRWPAATPGEAGHLLEYANTPDGPWTTLQFLPPDQTGYTHPNLIPETSFYYRLRPFSGPVSSVVKAGSPSPTTAPGHPLATGQPAPPRNPAPPGKPGSTAMPSQSAGPSQSAVPHQTAAPGQPTDTAATDQPAVPNQAVPGQPASPTSPGVPTRPTGTTASASVRDPGDAAVPTDLRATPGEDASVVFTWTDRATDEAGFLLELRKPGATGFTPIEVTDPNTTTCALSLMPGEQGSDFRVRALAYGPLSPVVHRTTGKG